jgi:hypothetical protein
MRNRATKGASSEGKLFSLQELSSVVKELQERVAQLEGEIRGTGQFLPMLSEECSSDKEMGRRPKLPTKEVIARRDAVSLWIEVNWPLLSLQLTRALRSKNKDVAIGAFAQVRDLGVVMTRYVPFQRDPARFADQVWAFVRSERFGGNPRNLAGALAGLPELSWKRSLDIAQEHALDTPLQPQAWRDHLRRRFNERFRELMRANTIEDVKAILKKSKSNDVTYRHMKKYPEEVLQWVVRPGIEEP